MELNTRLFVVLFFLFFVSALEFDLCHVTLGAPTQVLVPDVLGEEKVLEVQPADGGEQDLRIVWVVSLN